MEPSQGFWAGLGAVLRWLWDHTLGAIPDGIVWLYNWIAGPGTWLGAFNDNVGADVTRTATAVISAAILAYLTYRIKGKYYAIATGVGFFLLMWSFANNFSSSAGPLFPGQDGVDVLFVNMLRNILNIAVFLVGLFFGLSVFFDLKPKKGAFANPQGFLKKSYALPRGLWYTVLGAFAAVSCWAAVCWVYWGLLGRLITVVA